MTLKESSKHLTSTVNPNDRFLFAHNFSVFKVMNMEFVRHVTGNDQDYLRESPKWLFRYLRFSKRATVGVRATYATR